MQMPITRGTGNLLTQDADALVNTVNTEGIMGKGIALQFKKAWPAMFKDYVAACKRGEVALGRMHVWATGSLTGPRYIINFPTKRHWRARSRLTDIETGLQDLTRVIPNSASRLLPSRPSDAAMAGWTGVRSSHGY
jgi:O-acetyl-ADP-ribose deacetylase (regulator of RNase III)